MSADDGPMQKINYIHLDILSTEISLVCPTFAPLKLNEKAYFACR
jgi:hypothetical protein